MPALSRSALPRCALALAERLLSERGGDLGIVLIRGLVTATTSACGDVAVLCLGDLTDALPITTTGAGGEPIRIDVTLLSDEV